MTEKKPTMDLAKLSNFNQLAKQRLRYEEEVRRLEDECIEERIVHLRAKKQHEREIKLILEAKEVGRLLAEESKPLPKKRTNDRQAVIKKAREKAEDGNDAHSIYRALCEMALEKPPISPLAGYDRSKQQLIWKKWDSKSGDDIDVRQTDKNTLDVIRRHLAKNHTKAY